MSIPSNKPDPPESPVARAPQRRNGRQRFEALLDAGAAVFAERGYQAATMAEVGARAGANVGSVYRFFPTKAALAAALEERYIARAARAYDAIEARAPETSVEELADQLVDLLVGIHDETRALGVLLESPGRSADGWSTIRTWAVGRIARVVQRRSPGLRDEAATDMARVVLHNMKLLDALTFGETDSAAPEAAEVRRMNRLYLVDRLGSHGSVPR